MTATGALLRRVTTCPIRKSPPANRPTSNQQSQPSPLDVGAAPGLRIAWPKGAKRSGVRGSMGSLISGRAARLVLCPVGLGLYSRSGEQSGHAGALGMRNKKQKIDHQDTKTPRVRRFFWRRVSLGVFVPWWSIRFWLQDGFVLIQSQLSLLLLGQAQGDEAMGGGQV